MRSPAWLSPSLPGAGGAYPQLVTLVLPSQRGLQSPIRREHRPAVSYLLREWCPPGDQQCQSGCHWVRDGKWQGRCLISGPSSPQWQTQSRCKE